MKFCADWGSFDWLIQLRKGGGSDPILCWIMFYLSINVLYKRTKPDYDRLCIEGITSQKGIKSNRQSKRQIFLLNFLWESFIRLCIYVSTCSISWFSEKNLQTACTIGSKENPIRLDLSDEGSPVGEFFHTLLFLALLVVSILKKKNVFHLMGSLRAYIEKELRHIFLLSPTLKSIIDMNK